MGVSGFIVIRSYLYRRRLRRQLEEAIANGQVLTPMQGGIRPKSFGPKPKMWEIWISNSENEWENVVVSHLFQLLFFFTDNERISLCPRKWYHQRGIQSDHHFLTIPNGARHHSCKASSDFQCRNHVLLLTHHHHHPPLSRKHQHRYTSLNR
jgi:hypothetical protein